MLSQSGSYALRAVLHLASHGSGVPLQADAVARALGTPRNYMSKVLHLLARAGVLTSVRGPHGGYALAVPAAALTLERVVEPFEAVSRQGDCLLGRDACADGRCGVRGVCAAHGRWGEIARTVHGFFVTTTVAALVGAGDAPPKARSRVTARPAGAGLRKRKGGAGERQSRRGQSG